jgi:predicted transcriptional regulator
MPARLPTIEVDEATAQALEARAVERGVSVAEVVAELAEIPQTRPSMGDVAEMEASGRGAWAPDVLAEDGRRLAEFERNGHGVPGEEVEAWMRSWGTEDELPPPKLRKL